jgi:hypothetical protein
MKVNLLIFSLINIFSTMVARTTELDLQLGTTVFVYEDQYGRPNLMYHSSAQKNNTMATGLFPDFLSKLVMVIVSVVKPKLAPIVVDELKSLAQEIEDGEVDLDLSALYSPRMVKDIEDELGTSLGALPKLSSSFVSLCKSTKKFDNATRVEVILDSESALKVRSSVVQEVGRSGLGEELSFSQIRPVLIFFKSNVKPLLRERIKSLGDEDATRGSSLIDQYDSIQRDMETSALRAGAGGHSAQIRQNFYDARSQFAGGTRSMNVMEMQLAQVTRDMSSMISGLEHGFENRSFVKKPAPRPLLEGGIEVISTRLHHALVSFGFNSWKSEQQLQS